MANNSWEGVADAVAERYRSEYWYDANGNIDTLARYDQDGAQYDGFKYHYRKVGGRLVQNRLYELHDGADPTNDLVNAGPDEDAEDIAHTTGSFDPEDANINTAYNYGYDKRGNLIRDTREGITAIEWTVAGKVRSVTKSTGPSLAFAYGAGGHRTLKQVGDPDLGTGYREHYIRDAQGNIMAIYKYTNSGTASTKLVERPVYGSSRLGSYVKPQEVMGPGLISVEHTMPLTAADQRYELTDHLGNVSTVVTGRLLDGAGAGSQKQAEVISASGYEPFGSLMPGRNYSSDSYRFAFNGHEKDDEVHGATGTWYGFGDYGYDARVVQRPSMDPKASKYPYSSPYAAFGGNPILYVDRQGEDIVVYLVYKDGVRSSKPVLVIKSNVFTEELSFETSLPNVERMGDPFLTSNPLPPPTFDLRPFEISLLVGQALGGSDAFIIEAEAGFAFLGGPAVSFSAVHINKGEDQGWHFYQNSGPRYGLDLGIGVQGGAIDFNEDNSKNARLNRYTFTGKSQGWNFGLAAASATTVNSYTDGEWHSLFEGGELLYEGIQMGGAAGSLPNVDAGISRYLSESKLLGSWIPSSEEAPATSGN